MIYSTPTQTGYVYFQGNEQPPRRPPRTGPANIDRFAPSIPKQSTPLGFGPIAVGWICYPQTVEQVSQILQLETQQERATIEKKAEEKKEEEGIFGTIVKGIITTLAIKGILPW